MTAENGFTHEFKSKVIVIHLSDKMVCPYKQGCPDIEYPAKAYSDLQVDFETTQNARWTKKWVTLRQNF